MENRCPVCHISIEKGNYCPSCGLPKNNRPEHHSVKEYQLCAKCDTSNPFGAKYCRNCGQDIRTQAKDINGHGWVDLGLSVLWSAETMEGFYPWRDSSSMLTKYSSERLDLDFKGDGKDVASVKWGKKWRVPTMEEFGELISKCNWEKVVLNQSDEHALKVTGPNGKHILLKTTGRAGCRQTDPYYLGFHECEYQLCSFWTSTELVKEGFPPAGAAFSFSGYHNFEPTLTFDQKHGGKLNVFELGIRSFLRSLSKNEEISTSYSSESEDLNTSDFEERKRNELIDMQRRHALWLENPCNLEAVKRFANIGIMLPPNMGPRHKSTPLSIRPVADKKWKGKM